MYKLKSISVGLLDALNLLEHNKRRISLTNLAVLIIILKLATLSTFTLTEVGAFIVAMLGYAHKRHESNRMAAAEANSSATDIVKKVSELSSSIEDRLASLETKAAFTRKAN